MPSLQNNSKFEKPIQKNQAGTGLHFQYGSRWQYHSLQRGSFKEEKSCQVQFCLKEYTQRASGQIKIESAQRQSPLSSELGKKGIYHLWQQTSVCPQEG